MSVLSMGELLQISRVLRVSRVLKSVLSRAKDSPIIQNFRYNLFTNQPLEERIDKSIISDSEMSDDASANLRSIRGKIRRCNENVKAKLGSYITSGKYQKYLQDNIVTMRGAAKLFPLRQSLREQCRLVPTKSS